jgi:hypothetical protein
MNLDPERVRILRLHKTWANGLTLLWAVDCSAAIRGDLLSV